MFNPLVSIIIPFYNRFDLLEKSLNSVKQQTFTDYEVILVDDNSDEKIDLRNYRNIFGDKLIFHRLCENSGPGYARNEGRKLAKGKYVAYLDSDDEWDKFFLEKTVDALNSYKGISMVFTNTLIKTTGENTRLRNDMKSGAKDFFDLIINKKTYWATGSALWRSDISLPNNWSKYRDHEDYYHDITSLYNSSKIYYISDELCIVNKNTELGVKRSNSEMCLVLINVLNTFLKPKTNISIDFVDFTFSRLKRRKYSISDLYYFFIISYILLKKGYFKESALVYKIYVKKINK